MLEAKKPDDAKQPEPPNDEGRKVIEEYASGLREIIRRLKQKWN